ncbi:MAG TPA: type II toxin-antitoxin system RelE/ParE family toxin [Terriglobales bacterium]|nr:type II toxin-antitoxin system RelE/ParE family toxin [Terriglobales bacterium]
MSVKGVEYHQGAVADIKSAVAWYQKRSVKAALDLIEELDRAADAIREAPQRWPSGRTTPDNFCFGDFLSPFIYSEEKDVITIWAVAHGSRRPEYWKPRF